MKISVFGSSQPIEGDAAYAEARSLGALLAQRGHVVQTGGYVGTMEAVSRGANEAGGHVIGVTCAEIEKWRPVGANRWVKEERKMKTLIERLQVLVEDCDAAIALPGGPGTLTEISLLWNLNIIDAGIVDPIILIGIGWKSVFNEMFSSLGDYVSMQARPKLKFAENVDRSVEILDNIK